MHNVSKQDERFFYTQYGYIRTTVNVSVLVVLIFSQNFSTNGPYVVLIFCKFSDYMVLIFEKKSHTAYYVFQIGNYQASKQSFGSFLSKKLGSVNFCYKFLKSSKNFGPYFLKVQYQWSLISQISSTGPYMGGPYITILRVLFMVTYVVFFGAFRPFLQRSLDELRNSRKKETRIFLSLKQVTTFIK